MKKLLLTLVFAASVCHIASAQAEWACFSRYEKANSEITKAPKAVFYGDSITDIWQQQHPVFFEENNFAGRGISGTVTSQMLVRMRRDVIDLHPKYFVFLGGINDIAINQGPIDLEDTFKNIVSMVELARANKIKPIVCLLFPVDKISWRPEITDASEKVEKLNGMISDYCRQNKVPCVEYFSDVDHSDGRLPREISADSIHPNSEGYTLMENEILKYIK